MGYPPCFYFIGRKPYLQAKRGTAEQKMGNIGQKMSSIERKN